MAENTNYPAQLSIKYNDKSNRITVFFRLLLILPIAIILVFLAGTMNEIYDPHTLNISDTINIFGLLFFPIMLMIVFRQKYPKWWFDWIYELTKFSNRVWAYLMLLTDKYPATDDEQDVQIILEYPDAKNDLNRYLPLVKWLLAIPHILILIIFGIIAVLLSPIIWLIVLIIGKMPEQLFELFSGYMRYNLRVSAYAFLLITDKYPSFNWKK
ncbi:MAG: DUF4389 domain-containing protein [Candidatus Thioglobus sp.]|nr:MAG: DUF4389 domain-containing protein [Candidatus Thioglobus sp.]